MKGSGLKNIFVLLVLALFASTANFFSNERGEKSSNKLSFRVVPTALADVFVPGGPTPEGAESSSGCEGSSSSC
jgi:hypothetical protein